MKIQWKRRNRYCWTKNNGSVGAHYKVPIVMYWANLTRQVIKTFYFLRLTKGQFDDLVQSVSPLIEHQDTNYRCSITVGERLTVTLRFLIRHYQFYITIRQFDGSIDNSTIQAYQHSTIRWLDESTVWRFDHTTIRRFDEITIRIVDGPTTRPHTTIRRSDDTTIQLFDESTLRPY